MRILIADDSALFREGLTRLLTEAGHEVLAVADATALLDAVTAHQPEFAIIDIRMPPTMGSDGARAARQIRQQYPHLPMMLLSQHIETRQSVALVATGGFGYLLKDRVLGVDDFLDAIRRVAAGGSALDPEIVAALLASARRDDPLTVLTPREHEVLSLVAEGQSNAAVASRALPRRTHRRNPYAQHLPETAHPRHRRRAPPRAGRTRLPQPHHTATSLNT